MPRENPGHAAASLEKGTKAPMLATSTADKNVAYFTCNIAGLNYRFKT